MICCSKYFYKKLEYFFKRPEKVCTINSEIDTEEFCKNSTV